MYCVVVDVGVTADVGVVVVVGCGVDVGGVGGCDGVGDAVVDVDGDGYGVVVGGVAVVCDFACYWCMCWCHR